MDRGRARARARRSGVARVGGHGGDPAYADEDVAVVEKPAGMPTAPTPEGDRGSVADALARDLLGGRVHVVHRLDLPTSGLLVFARSDRANRALSETFRRHDVEREYLAVVRGRLEAAELAIDDPIGGRRALTRVAVAEALGDGATLVRARLETGRTHQIRIHLARVGHPVLGDRQHGARTSFDPPRLALHAALLAFAHPATGEPLRFESAWPDDLGPWLERLREESRAR
ncbi:MAG TPA: RluA family pseudouridine synthase [Candidatus Binatia bacterium]|nr:RluA family pseudouridine synthase [Candidatus Binatia bacterium]